MISDLSMNDFAKGGRGKKAPYESQMYRVPVPIKPTVERLGAAYRLLAKGALDPQGKQLLSKVEDAITASTYPTDKPDIKNGTTAKPDIKNELDDSEDENEDEEELEEAEDLEQTIRDQARKLQELIVDRRMLEREKQALDQELNQLHSRVGDLTLELANCQEQVKARTIVHPDAAIALLNEALGLKANAGGAIKLKVKEAIALLIGGNPSHV